MNTRNPISTISYNSMLFLKAKLDELVNAKVIQFYAFIFHKGEDDEAGKKDHAGRKDTNQETETFSKKYT